MSDSPITFAVDDFKAIARRMAEIAADEESNLSIIAARNASTAIVADPVRMDPMTGRLIPA